MDGDIIAQAQTGGGKSAAYLLPIIDAIHRLKCRRKESTNSSTPYAVVIVPTRELTSQLYENTRAFSNGNCFDGVRLLLGTLVRPVRAFGKFSLKENVLDIQDGCDIVFCTTGRLKAFIKSGTLDLSKAIYLVLDEADELIRTADNFVADIHTIKKYMVSNF